MSISVGHGCQIAQRVITVERSVMSGVRVIGLDQRDKLVGIIIGVLDFGAGLIGNGCTVIGRIISRAPGGGVCIRNYLPAATSIVAVLRGMAIRISRGN